MILERVNIRELAGMLEPHMRKPAWPGLDDKQTRARAKRWAKRLGIWDSVPGRFHPDRPIPVIKRSDYRDYQRTGERDKGQAPYSEKLRETEGAALALWLGHPAADVEYLQDLLWAWCETTTWVWPAHESVRTDLLSTRVARVLSEILWMFEGVLEEEVAERVGEAIEERALNAVYDWKHPALWYTKCTNWNHVCNANMITTALYRIRDAYQLAAFIHPLCRRLDYGVQGFADDGGCTEGPSYWNYGFGHFLDAALVLRQRTGGKVNLMEDEKIKRVCRYPLAAHLQDHYFTTFADSSHGYLEPFTALKINQFFKMPELYALCRRTQDGRLDIRDWQGLALYRGEKATTALPRRDYLLPELGQVTLRNGKGTAETILAALAGHSGVPHNHNDIGSFIVFKKGRCVLTDPGAPKYTRKTFSKDRYTLLFCRSKGHSVPLINGHEQGFGEKYLGVLSAEGLNTEGEKTVTINMTKAYQDKTLKQLERELVLSESGVVRLADSFEFTTRPRALEEAFVTFEPAKVLKRGRLVRIGSGRRTVTLSAVNTDGVFRVQRLVKESREGRTGEVVNRVVFLPGTLARSMHLCFVVE